MVDLNKVKNILTGLKPELVKKYPIASIGLFGPIVHGDFNFNSNIDIIMEFTSPIDIKLVSLTDELEEKLDWKVDLVSRAALKPKYFSVIEHEIIYI